MRRLIDHEHPMFTLAPGSFREQVPFPSLACEGLLHESAFEKLDKGFPELQRFERQDNRLRRYGQRPHNRYYLELAAGRDDRRGSTEGTVALSELAPSWQRFIGELSEGPYLQSALGLLGVKSAPLKFSWHIAIDGDEVSPHLDLRRKIGTHLFYFNAEPRWHPDWDGATLLLGERTTSSMSPEFDQFLRPMTVEVTGNRSLLFQNSRVAWHGMRRLDIPPGVQRRCFSVVFESASRTVARIGDAVDRLSWRLSRVARTFS